MILPKDDYAPAANDDPRADTLARAVRLRNATVGHFNDPLVLRVAAEIGEAFLLRTDAVALTPIQAMAVAVRVSYALGVATHRMLVVTSDGDPDYRDLDAFRAAYAALVDTGIEVASQMMNADGETIQ
jgi:hypothetical protein